MEKWDQIFKWSKRVQVYLEDEHLPVAADEDPLVRRVVERLRTPGYLQGKEYELRKFDAEDAFRRLRRRRGLRGMWRMWVVAASVLLLLGGGLWLFWEVPELEEAMSLAKQEIVPGERKAILLLNDGRQFELKDSLPVEIQTQEGVIHVDTAGVVLGVDMDCTGAIEEKYNMLFIPRGCEYHLTLSDGTAVWLNSETELRFPIRFQGKNRQVYLRGEAYFEVKSNTKQDFLVKTAAGNVKVLGTAFDVMIYDTTRLVATLESGTISYSSGKHSEVLLRPGEQLVYSTKDKRIHVKKVNTRLYTAWKDDLFCFEEQRLDEIMLTLSRWYNLEVRFEEEALKCIELSGTLERNAEVQPLLRYFELGTNVRFEISGNVIVIKKAK